MLTAQYIHGLTRALVRDIREIKPAKNWAAAVDLRILYYNPEMLSQVDDDTVRALTLHEIGHLLHTSSYQGVSVKKYPKKKKGIKYCINILEDARIEIKLGRDNGDYVGNLLYSNTQRAFNNYNWEAAPDYSSIMCYGFSKIRGMNATKLTDKLNSMNREKRDVAIEISRLVDEHLDTFQGDDFEKMVDLFDSEIMPLILPYLPDDTDETPEELEQMMERAGRGRGKKSGTERENVRDGVSHIDALAEMNPYINTLSTKIKQILKETRSTRETGLHKRGKLLSKNTYKVLCGDTRIFSKRTNPDVPDYNVQLLLDNSGSICLEDMHIGVMQAAVLIEQVFQKIGMRVDLFKYDDHPKTLESLTEYEESPQGENFETRAFEHIIEHIKKNNLENNLLMMITDGDGDSWQVMYPYIEELEKNLDTKICVIGVGRGAEDVVMNYPERHIFVPDIEMLTKSVVGFLHKLIHR